MYIYNKKSVNLFENSIGFTLFLFNIIRLFAFTF